MKIRDYKFGFVLSALLLFAVIMLPNILWFCVPAENDVLRATSKAPVLDAFATVFQVVTVAALCLITNRNAEKVRPTRWLFVAVACLALYYVCWGLYYARFVHGFVLSGLAVFPCCAFIFYAVDRKNYPALVPASLFTVLHFISAIVNFL